MYVMLYFYIKKFSFALIILIIKLYYINKRTLKVFMYWFWCEYRRGRSCCICYNDHRNRYK